ncbi:MAG TPA: hypothetical protein VIR57_20705 [Chloroflexota bacterium]|jgi:threonine dehydrogenase-like Zn-dependent dehydrogenase
MLAKTLTVYAGGGNGGRGQYETALDLTVRGKIHPDWLITHRLSLAEATRGFEIAGKKQEGVIKVVLEP